MVLAGLGLGSLGLGGWIQGHKVWFLTAALGLISVSIFMAIRERKRTGRNTGLVVAAFALLLTLSLLAYNRLRYGYFM